MDENRSNSAERLNEYIRIGSPGIIALIVALAVVFVAIIYWGFTGKLHETEEFTGIVDISADRDINIFVNADIFDGRQMTGKPVNIKLPDRSTTVGTVISSSPSPLTEDEFGKKYDYSSWDMNKLIDGVYSYVIGIDAEEDLSDYQGQLVEVFVIMNEVSPISFVMR